VHSLLSKESVHALTLLTHHLDCSILPIASKGCVLAMLQKPHVLD
jgi:hypothetical protein